MFDSYNFPGPEDETKDAYARCRYCGSRITHLREEYFQIWHCHSCGAHWSEEGLDPLSLSYEVERLGECRTENYDLGPFGP